MSPAMEMEEKIRGKEIDRRGFFRKSIKGSLAFLSLSVLGGRASKASEEGIRSVEAGFSHPYGVVEGDDGRCYVTDSGNYCVKVLGRDGRLTGKFGSPGGAGNRLNYPKGITFDPEGNLAVVDSNNGRVAVFNREGEYIRDVGKFGGFTGAFFSPESLDFDGEGRLYVADTRAHRVQVLDYETGDPLHNWGGLGDDPTDLREGSLDYKFRLPTDVWVSEEGRIYVVDSKHGEIKALDREGRFLFKFSRAGSGDGDLNFPTSLCVHPSGALYVTDTGNGRVQKFDPEGRYLAKVDKIFDKPCGISLTAEGGLAVVDKGHNKLIIIGEF